MLLTTYGRNLSKDMEVYRVTKDSPKWLIKAYDYARTDAFVFGQDIPITLEYSHDDPIDDDYKAVVLIDDNKPVAGCKITFPFEGVGKIGRVCVIREYQKRGIGRRLIKEAEKWINESGIFRIVINSQDRAQKFYEKLGYELVPKVNPRFYEDDSYAEEKSIPHDYIPRKNDLGFSCVLVEKKIS